jgi:hypothetical protein
MYFSFIAPSSDSFLDILFYISVCEVSKAAGGVESAASGRREESK